MEDTDSSQQSVQNGLSSHDTSAVKKESLARGSEGDHADWDEHVSSLQNNERVLERTQSPNMRNFEDLKTRPVKPPTEYIETEESNAGEDVVAKPVTPPLPESEEEDVSSEPIRPPPEFQENNDQNLSHDTSISNAHQDSSNTNSSSSRTNASDILNDGKESSVVSEDPLESGEDEVVSYSSSEVKTSEEGREGGRESSEVSSNGGDRSGGMNGRVDEIAAVTQAKVDVEESLRTGGGGGGEGEGGAKEQGVEDEVKIQTSFVNEYALNSTEDSPMSEVDRKLEQFSEILLDSDASHSDEEAPAKEQAEEDTTSPKMKSTKRVRFADEVAGSLVDGQLKSTSFTIN